MPTLSQMDGGSHHVFRYQLNMFVYQSTLKDESESMKTKVKWDFTFTRAKILQEIKEIEWYRSIVPKSHNKVHMFIII